MILENWKQVVWSTCSLVGFDEVGVVRKSGITMSMSTISEGPSYSCSNGSTSSCGQSRITAFS